MSNTTLRERMALLDELSQIVNAMKNLAFAELRRLTRLQQAQDQAEAVMRKALASVITQPQAIHQHRVLWLIIGAETGFCGGFNEQIAQTARALRAQHPNVTWLIAGNRLQQQLDDDFPDAIWLPGSNNSEDVAQVVDDWRDALTRYATNTSNASSAATATAIWILHHGEHQLVQQQIMPLADLPPAPSATPLRYLPDDKLLPALLAEALRIKLMGAQYTSLLHENHARLAQMQRARDHLEEAGENLQRKYFRQRQADITGELQTLMASMNTMAVSRSVQ